MVLNFPIPLSFNLPILSIGVNKFDTMGTKNVISLFNNWRVLKKFIFNIEELNEIIWFGIENAIN